MEVIRQGLADHYVRFGRRLALVQRAKRILSSSGFRKKGKEKKHDQYKDLDLTEPSQPRSVRHIFPLANHNASWIAYSPLVWLLGYFLIHHLMFLYMSLVSSNKAVIRFRLCTALSLLFNSFAAKQCILIREMKAFIDFTGTYL